MTELIPFSNFEPHGKWVMAFHTPSFLAAGLYYCIDNMGHHFCNNNYMLKRTDYNSYMFLVTISGKGSLIYNGTKYDLLPNTVVFINCTNPHEYNAVDDSWNFYWVHFNGAMSTEYYDHINKLSGPVINITTSLYDFSAGIEQMLHLKLSSDINFEPKASNIISNMLNSLVVVLTDSENKSTDSISSKIAASIDYIKENYMNNIHIEDISCSAFLSHYHFIRTFKQVTGFSPYEYLIKYRINRAKILITHSDTSIRDISAAVGFPSVNNFISTFKKYENTTPYNYRKNHSFVK